MRNDVSCPSTSWAKMAWRVGDESPFLGDYRDPMLYACGHLRHRKGDVAP